MQNTLLDFSKLEDAQKSLFDEYNGKNLESFIAKLSAKRIGFIMQAGVLNNLSTENIRDGTRDILEIDVKIQN